MRCILACEISSKCGLKMPAHSLKDKLLCSMTPLSIMKKYLMTSSWKIPTMLLCRSSFKSCSNPSISSVNVFWWITFLGEFMTNQVRRKDARHSQYHKTNTDSERDFTQLDRFLRKKPNATTILPWRASSCLATTRQENGCSRKVMSRK